MTKIKSADELTKFTPISAGIHTLRLAKVEERETANIFADKAEDGTYLETGTETPPIKAQLLWVFESDDKAPSGEPYAYAYWTGRYYGDDRAKLTTLLDAILPDSTPAERAAIDTDSLLGARFRLRIATKKNQKGQDRPVHTLIEPAASVHTPPPDAPVLGSVRDALGIALHAAAEREGQAALKSRLLVELGRLRYNSWGDFIARGQKDAGQVLAFISPGAKLPDPDLPF